MAYIDLASYKKTDLSASLLLSTYSGANRDKKVVLLKPDFYKLCQVFAKNFTKEKSREVLYSARFTWILELLRFMKDQEKFGCYFCHKGSILDLEELPKFEEFLNIQQAYDIEMEESLIAKRIIENI